jgi:hypothetical protein
MGRRTEGIPPSLQVLIGNNLLPYAQRESSEVQDMSSFFFFYVGYSTLPHLPPLRFHCVGGRWDRTQDSCDYVIGCQTLEPHSARSHPQMLFCCYFCSSPANFIFTLIQMHNYTSTPSRPSPRSSFQKLTNIQSHILII